MSADHDFPAPRARREAARWLALHDRRLTGAEQDEFLQWLAADPRHGEWFARHRCGWQRLDRISAWHPQHGAEPNPDVLAQPPRRRHWARSLLLAAAAVVVLAGGLALRLHSSSPPTSPARALAETGGYERRVLGDGSVVELTGGAELDVDFTPGERRVVLQRGEALFTIAKNPERPFIVRAGEVHVRAVGTAFNVRLGSERVEVLVTEGRVQVAPAASPAAPPLVNAGEFAVVARTGSGVPRVSPAPESERARIRAWQPQLLDFASTPLADVLAELNRRNRVQLVLTDPALGGVLIAASIRSDNVEGFVQLLATTARLRAEPEGDYRILLRRAN